MQGLMKGKRGLIMGVANDHSLAWGIAKRLGARGCLGKPFDLPTLLRHLRELAPNAVQGRPPG